MKKLISFIVFSFLIFSCYLFVTKIGKFPNRQIAQAGSVDGEYEIIGRSTEKGNFAGHGWVKDGVVQRAITWQDYSYEGNSVESIWSGVVSEKSFEFTLKLSNVITRFEDFEAVPEDFKPVKVSLPINAISSEVSFSLTGDGPVKETWTRVKDASAEPLWVDQRQSFVGVGEKHPLIRAIAKLAGIYKVIENYRAQPAIKQYEAHPEFKKGEQIFITDKTDADFYVKNPKTLRITNKTINPLSLAEAVMRKNAYGHTLAYKAKFLGDETNNLNLNAAGMLEVATIDKDGNKTGQYGEGDSALWSSMYAWSEVMRYKTTKSSEALANFKKVLNGELTLIEITEDPKQFARSLAVSPPEENLGENWIQGKGKYAHLKWLKGGNNDMSKGLFITLSLAHQVVNPEEVELIERIQKAVKHLDQPEAIAERTYNVGLAIGLDALWNKDEERLKQYHKKMLNIESALSKLTHLDAGLYIGGIADWSGIHLTMTSTMSKLLLAQELVKVFPDQAEKTQKVLTAAEDSLMEITEVYKNAHRGYLYLITYAYSPKARKDKEFTQKAKEAIWSLREVPAPRFVGNATAHMFKHPDWSVSAWPRQPWKGLKSFRKLREDYDTLQLIQGAYSYPYFEATSWSTTYFWKDIPFPVAFSSNKFTKSFSSDYLMVYWVSRNSGLISAED